MEPPRVRPSSHRSARSRLGLPSAVLVLVAVALAGVAAAGAGVLGPGDERLGTGELFDRVLLDGAAGDEVTIELASDAFDPYLIVLDPSERVLFEEDDTPGHGLGVRATLRLPATGRYTIVVTSAYPEETGAYRLVLAGAGAAATGRAVPPAGGGGAAGAAPETTTATEPRTVTGTVRDTAGRPIAGARVWIQPAITTGVVEVRTDEEGRYRAASLIDVPYVAKAWAEVSYGGRRLCLRLGMDAPSDYDAFVPTHGAVRDFRWQLTGPIEDLRSLDEHFGGMLRVMNTGLYAGNGARIEFSFTPTGPRIDGSSVAPFVRTLEPGRETDVRDLPVGPYRIAATLVDAAGGRRALRLAADSLAPAAETMALDWTGDGTCSNSSGVGWAYAWLAAP